ncbi:MAG: hypothetical protein GEEBNDBF_01805 [bacterium]|nr:hypothetical protein [bacterium]
MRPWWLSLLLMFSLLVPVAAEPTADAVAEGKPDLKDLAWLVGTWEGEHFGSLAIMTVHAPAGHTMAGVYQVVDPDGTCSIIEYDLIEATPDGLRWHYAIYGPGMTPLTETPFGHKGTYNLEVLADGRVRYWHDDPTFSMKEAFIERTGKDEMKSVVVLRGEEGEMVVEFVSHRRSPATPE